MLGNMQDVIQDTHGNVSEIDEDGSIYIKPSGVPYSRISRGMVCKISVDGKQLIHSLDEDALKPSVDTVHHAAIYKRHKRIKAICHTHSPYATAYAYNGKSIRCLGTEQADFFGDDVYNLPYSDLNCWGKEAAMYVGGKPVTKAILLNNHGVLTFGETAEEAVKLAAALENCARKNYLAETLFNNDSRHELAALPIIEIVKWHDRYTNKYGQ